MVEEPTRVIPPERRSRRHRSRPSHARIVARRLIAFVFVLGLVLLLAGGAWALLGGNDHVPGKAPVRPGTPVVRVRAFSLMGGVDVKVGRSRRERRAGIS